MWWARLAVRRQVRPARRRHLQHWWLQLQLRAWPGAAHSSPTTPAWAGTACRSPAAAPAPVAPAAMPELRLRLRNSEVSVSWNFSYFSKSGEKSVFPLEVHTRRPLRSLCVPGPAKARDGPADGRTFFAQGDSRRLFIFYRFVSTSVLRLSV